MKKNHFSALLYVLMVLILSVAFSTTACAAYYGDINKDGAVKSDDARAILRIALKLEKNVTEEQKKIADVDQDGKVISKDARTVLRMALKLEDRVEMPEDTKPSEPTDPVPPVTKDPTPPTTPEKPTQPSEPSTETPPEPSTETPPEPSTEVPPEPSTEPEPAVGETMLDDQCYVDVVVKTYDAEGNQKDAQSMKTAYQTRTEKGLAGKKITVKDFYVRSQTLFPGHDIGMLVNGTVGAANKVTQDYYLINYDENEYMCLDHSVADSLGSGLIGDEMETTIAVLTFKDLKGWNAETVVKDGITYSLVTTENNDGTLNKYYLVKKDGRDFYEPEIVENCTKDGVLITSMLVRAYDPDPSAYLKAPADMKGLKITSLNMLTKINEMMAFMEKIGLTA